MRLSTGPLALCLFGLLASCGAASQTVPPFNAACPACAHPETGEPLVSDGLFPARFLALSAALDTHMTSTESEPHLRTGPNVELTPFFDRNGNWRWLFTTGVSFGAWGDQQHGDFILQGATGPKFHLLGSDAQLVDVYGLLTEGVLGGWGNLAPGRGSEAGNIAGGGLGVDVFRAFTVELTAHWVYAFDSPFRTENGSDTTRSVPDFGLAIGVDTCAFGSFCNRAPKTQQTVDSTCAIYKDTQAVCGAADAVNGRQELCQHAADALALRDDVAGPLARNSFREFLEEWRSCGRLQECLLAQQGQKVETHRIYSPYAVEALSALGCKPDGTVTGKCNDYVCEDPGSKPATCAGH
jgi:hypothetical protein